MTGKEHSNEHEPLVGSSEMMQVLEYEAHRGRRMRFNRGHDSVSERPWISGEMSRGAPQQRQQGGAEDFP